MGKKFYAVRKGTTIGIFEDWDKCKESVSGYPGAEYKSFPTRSEAEDYLNGGTGNELDSLEANVLLAYVDGSFEESIGKYAFGCVFPRPDGTVYTVCGNGSTPEAVAQRNVAGEMLGAMYAVRMAIYNGFTGIKICYDYEGIEKWVTGAWKARTDLTSKYAQAMNNWGRTIKIQFKKVPAHSNVEFNEIADQEAKRGLVEADGVPEYQKFEEMTPYRVG